MKIQHCIRYIVIAAMVLFIVPGRISAGEPVSDGAASLLSHEIQTQSNTKDRLYAYLSNAGSPLADNAQDFIDAAIQYNLDWRLVAAIAGLESTFGKRIPIGSFNAWGWGIPTGQKSGIGFSSWKEGIYTVSEGLRTKYLNKGAVGVYGIGKVYAASETWAVRVEKIMKNILDFDTNTTAELPFSL